MSTTYVYYTVADGGGGLAEADQTIQIAARQSRPNLSNPICLSGHQEEMWENIASDVKSCINNCH